MYLSPERAEKLVAYLDADPLRAKEWLDLPVEDAVARINADGYDFTKEELMEFDETLVAAFEFTADGELHVEELDNISGGGGCISLAISIIAKHKKYAWDAGQRIGEKIKKKIANRR